jgi:hypothetical protein
MSPFRTMLAARIPLSFDVVARPVLLSLESEALECPDCQAPIDLHQPDESQPTVLLGTCLMCSKWFILIEIDDASRIHLMVELPTAECIREILEASLSEV